MKTRKLVSLVCICILVSILIIPWSNVYAQTWEPLGEGMNDDVLALCEYDGELYAGGRFTQINSNQVKCIAKWDGTSWSDVGEGLNSYVYALAVYNNELYVGGFFLTAVDGTPVRYIAKWDGTSWSDVGGGTNGYIASMAVFNDTLYVGGHFDSAGVVQAKCIAKWDGSQWSEVGGGMNASVQYLTVHNDILFAGGAFYDYEADGSPNYIARWDGSSWSEVGGGTNSTVEALVSHNGELFAGGWFSTAGGNPVSRIAKWDDNNWSAVGVGMNSPVYSLVSHNGELFAGGYFTTAGGNTAWYIARWDGTSWSDVDIGMNDGVNSLYIHNGELYAGGSFTYAGSNQCNRVARWDCPIPEALFTHTDVNLTANFTNVSTGSNPDWQWDFGDGNTSTDENPVHTYAEEDTYSVCLIASNECGSDTFCNSTTVTPNGTDENFGNQLENAVKVFPNPARTDICLSISSQLARMKPFFVLYDLLGKEMKREKISQELTKIPRGNLPEGVYFYQLKTDREKPFSGKIVIQ